MRRLASDDPEVNEEWITDKDRFAFTYSRGRRPADPPLVREPTDGDVLRPASWPEAVDVTVQGLQAGAGVGERRRVHRRSAAPLRTRTRTPSSPGPCSAPTTSTSAPGRTPEEADFLAHAVGRERGRA